jgi:thymidylate synthase
MTTFNDTYAGLLAKIMSTGIETRPRGIRVKELLCEQFVIGDANDNVVTLPGFATNVEYAKKELEWYYAGTNRVDFDPVIERTWKQFSDDGKHVNSAYGHRIFGKHPGFVNQWEWVKNKLLADRDSRQCVMNLNDVNDKVRPTKDFVCTVFCQQFIRDDKLVWLTAMRSQDVVLGTRNDVYCFTEMQKRLASELGVAPGKYVHFCASLHLYEKHWSAAQRLLGQ